MLASNNLNERKYFSPETFVSFKNEIFYGGYFIALIGPALVITTAILANTSLSLPLLIISYIIPLMVYSFDYYQDMDKDKDTNQERSAHFTSKKKVYPYIMGSYVALLAIMLLFFSNWMMITYIMGLIMVGVFYSIGLKGLTQKLPGFKNIYTVFIWSLAGSFSVAFFNAQPLYLVYLFVFLLIFLKMLPNAFFFDLKDVKSDRREGLKTLPVLLGKKKTINLLLKMNILAFIPFFIGIYLNIIPLYASVMLVFLFYSWYYLHGTSKRDGETVMKYRVMADAEFMLWPVVLVIGQFLFSVV